MVLSVLVAIIAAPALLASQESIRQSQGKEKREEHRARRCNLIATCVKSSMRSRELDGRPIVLRNGKLYIDIGTSDGSPFGHQYAGYYLPYPDTEYEGLVTTINDEAPVMNWVYVDRDTCEVKYGIRADAQPNLTGPFDCTRQDRRLTFAGWEGWCVVEESTTVWALYFDKDDDGLRSKVPPGTRVLEIELTRKEKRFQMDTTARRQDQATQRAVDVKADAPTDAPISIPPLQQPGVRTAPLEPLKIPTPIFVQEPQSEAPLPPKTPPPAYTPNFESVPLPAVTPPTTSSTSLQPTALSEKRATPKLNRSSGTQALEQAKKFERLSQTFNENVPRRDESLVSRPADDTGLTDSAFNYTDLLKTDTETLEPVKGSERPISSILAPQIPLPDPISVPQKESSPSSAIPVSSEPDPAIVSQKSKPITVVSPTSDPAVFGGYGGAIDEDRLQRSKSPANGSVVIEKLLQRKSSTRRTPDSQVPKTPLPAASGNQRPGLSGSGAYFVETSSSDRRRPKVTVSNEKSKNTFKSKSISTSPPPQRRRGGSKASQNEEGSRSILRAGSRTATATSSTTASRQRNDSTSTQKSDVSRINPKAPTRTATAPNISQNSIQATKNQGVYSSLGPKSAVKRRERCKTTSALFREIDDFLQLDGSRSGANTTDFPSAQAPAARARRPPPLKKVETATPNLLRADGSFPKRDGLGAKPMAERKGEKRI